MGILKRCTVFALSGIVLMMVQCTIDAPTAPSTGNCAFSITAAATAVRPDELVITVIDKLGTERKQVVNPVPENGSSFFPEIPWGPVVVDITGKVQGIRRLYGHTVAELAMPSALVKVRLRGTVSAKNFDPAQEQTFLQIAASRSALWGAFPEECVVNSAAVDGRASMRTSIGASSRFLYFLFEVTDNTMFSDDRPAGTAGEFTSDAVVVYVGKIAPHALSPEKQPFPASRFQCSIGKTIPENGQFNFVNFTSGATRSGIVRDLADEDLRARILLAGTTSRLLELRVRKGLIAIPEGVVMEIRQFGLVVRYRNNFNVQQPAQLIDWQTGAGDNDPRTADASWGYLELYP